MRVGDDGGVLWEHWRELNSEHDVREIAFTITAMLGVPPKPAQRLHEEGRTRR